MILIDTSGLLAALGDDQPRHEEAVRVLLAARAPLLLSPFVLAELDYLIARRLGVSGELTFLDEVARGAYEVADFSNADVDEAKQVIARYHDLGIGLADASLAVLSHRTGCLDLLTLDERHFRIVRGAGGDPFRILPADG